MRQSGSQRKSKIELTCRLSAEKLRTSQDREGLGMTPPKYQHQPILLIGEDAPPKTLSTSQSEAPAKKTRRKTSALQIDIECIEDEYAKKSMPKIIIQDTPLFASGPKKSLQPKRNIIVDVQPVLHEPSESLSRTITEECTTRVLELSKESEKYSYDNLIQAIKLHHRQQSSLSIDRDPPSYFQPLMKDISKEHEQKRNLLPVFCQSLEMVRTLPEQPLKSTTKDSDAIKRQFNKTRQEVMNLKELLKANPKMEQIKLLMESLEKEIAEIGIHDVAPIQPKHLIGRQQNSSQAVEIENSRHFQSIHQRPNGKERSGVSAVASQSSLILRKFNTEQDESTVHCPLKSGCTKSPFRQIMNYMSKRK